jgi:hypothetical protein
MKTNESNEAIKLNSTFMRLSTGQSTISGVIAQRAAIRAALMAGVDSAVRRLRESDDHADPFSTNFCR